MEPFRAFLSNLERFGAMWSILKLFRAIWSNFELFGACKRYLEPFKLGSQAIFVLKHQLALIIHKIFMKNRNI